MTLLLSKNDFKLIICLCLAFPFLYFWTVLNVAETLRSGSGGPGTAPGPGNAEMRGLPLGSGVLFLCV